MSDAMISEKQRILIVDDSEDMRFLLGQILEDEAYELVYAETGSEAIELANHTLPALILMDMSLPGMSGWSVVPLLRQLPAFAHTPIIAVTAHVSPADQDRAFSIGCTAHLGKPFDVMDVVNIITNLLHQEHKQAG